MGIARLGALAEAGLPVRRAMPPFQHVAFEELLAGMQQDLRAREPRLDEDQRQHVLQLIAEAERAAALVGADAAEQTRGHHLIGQPGVDQPVEVGAIGRHSNRAQTPRPMRARRGELRLDIGDLRRARGVARQNRGSAAWPSTMAIVVCAPGGNFDVARKGRDPAAVVALRGVRRAGLDHRRRGDVAPRPAEEAGAHRLLDRVDDRLVAANATPC